MALIQQLRIFEIIKPHWGSDDARHFVNALGDELDPLVKDEQVRSIVREMTALFGAALAQSEARVIKFVVGASAAVIATMGICTGIIVAFLG